MSDRTNFDRESLESISAMAQDAVVRRITQEWIDATGKYRYVYNWKWLGLPIIQLPADIVVTQEIIWDVKPTVIIETGVARGGSIVFNASQLAMLDVCDLSTVGLAGSKRKCIGIDVEIRPHNRIAIEQHPLAPMIVLCEGSSVEQEVIRRVGSMIEPGDRVMVILDSNHTHEHVLRELELYSGFVSIGSFLVVHDTGIATAPPDAFDNRDWGPGNNPLTALRHFCANNGNFVVEQTICDKLLVTSSPSGYLRRVS